LSVDAVQVTLALAPLALTAGLPGTLSAPTLDDPLVAPLAPLK
jgi:hypothetical protein